MGFRLLKDETFYVYMSGHEDVAVRKATANLCVDLKKICNANAVLTDNIEDAKIIIETAGEADAKKYPELFDLDGKLIWEAYLLKVTEGRLYVSGSGRRGTIFGIYELTGMWGVSPWYWFADVPVRTKAQLKLPEGFVKTDYPTVKYRGIFINDEEELEAWAINYMKETTIGPKTYEKVFEFLLRLKANYIWPAMHVNAFNMDRENGRLANEMGIIVGTSHCDMLLRSNQNEWEPWVKKKGYEGVEYDYSIEGRNREIIREYWTESIEQNKDYDVCYTVGMRGIHDTGFVTREISDNSDLTEEEKKQAKIKLLENVIKDQQDLIHTYASKDDNPQTFIPYKEVLSLYDAGLNVPEDITLMWVNDNFGYMRRYPSDKEQKRKGGNGLYYHASYWGHPAMSYLFINSIPLAQTKNELKKAYENGIRQMWVLNAGAIKPLEADIEFFLTYAWEIAGKEEITGSISGFIESWINRNFEGNYGSLAAEIYEEFSQITNVRKLEHMKSNVFSQTAYGNEAARRMLRYQDLFEKTVKIHNALKENEKDAFLQLFAMKIYAAYFINASFYFADRSALMYDLGFMKKADEYTSMSMQMDEHKRRLLYYYNKVMSGGKWDKILTPECFLPPCTALYPACKPALVICEEDVEIVEASNEIENNEAVTRVTTIATDNITCNTTLYKSETGFSENDGYVSMLAHHYEKNSGWREIKNLGRYEGNLMEADNGELEFEFNTVSEGEYLLEFYRFPSLNSKGRLRVGISIDDGKMQILESDALDEWCGNWKQNVLNHVEKMYLKLPNMTAGKHKLIVHSIDRYVAFSKIVIYTNEFAESNIGPAESYHPVHNKEIKRCNYDYYPDIEALEKLSAWMFKCEKAPLPDVIFADKEFWKKDRLYLKNETREQKELGRKKYISGVDGKKNVYEMFGEGVFVEKNGIIAFGSEYVIENSENAFCKLSDNNIVWEHTQSETNGRTGLAMHIPQSNLEWNQKEGAPSLNYRISCSGGRYNVWLLLKYDDGNSAQCAIGIDDNEIPQDKMFNNGYLFNFGTQQNWVWMIVTEADMEEGNHLFSIYARATGLRVDRIYLTKTEERPPIDSEWEECERKIIMR